MPSLHRTLIVSAYHQARSALASAKEELKDAEIRTMRADTKVTAAKSHLNTLVEAMKAIDKNEAVQTVPSNEADEKVAFKALTDALQSIQMYAIMNGKSLGPTMDALTGRLFGREPEVLFKQSNDAIQTIQEYAITNGISLGSTMDAVTERLFSEP